MNAEKTVVIFRKFLHVKDGVIAVFPELAASEDADECLSYMHVGQHGACSLSFLFREGATVPCDNSEDYAPLKKELEGLGYTLQVWRSDMLNGWEPRHWDAARKAALK